MQFSRKKTPKPSASDVSGYNVHPESTANPRIFGDILAILVGKTKEIKHQLVGGFSPQKNAQTPYGFFVEPTLFFIGKLSVRSHPVPAQCPHDERCFDAANEFAIPGFALENVGI